MSLWDRLLHRNDDDDEERKESSSKIARIAKDYFGRIPKRYRIACLVLWLSWKVVSTALVVYVVWRTQARTSSQSHLRRVLYMVTVVTDNSTSIEPLLRNALESKQNMIDDGLDVHLYLIVDTPQSGYQTTTDAIHALWDDAAPLTPQSSYSIYRQHRCVVRDHVWAGYDLFVATDHSTLVPRGVVDHYWELSQQLDSTRDHDNDGEDRVIPAVVTATTEAERSVTKGGGVVQPLERLSSSPGRTLGEIPLNATATGWIATQRQILLLHSQYCTFLPPFLDDDAVGVSPMDKLYTDKEWWIGGGQIASTQQGGCGRKRVASLTNFSNHLLVQRNPDATL